MAPEPGFDLLTALPRFAPEVRLHPDDPHRPSSVEWYLKRTRLRLRRGLLCRDEELLPLGRVTSEKLGELTNRSDDPESLYLGIPRGAHRRDTRRGFRPVGGMLSAPCYVNARAAPDDPSAFDLQYWFFYPFNGREGRHIPHEGDWEHITVRVTNSADPRLLRTYISAHGQENGGWASPDGEESRGRILRLNSTGNPIIYSALGSHASYGSGCPKAGVAEGGRQNVGRGAGMEHSRRPGAVGGEWPTAGRELQHPSLAAFSGTLGSDTRSGQALRVKRTHRPVTPVALDRGASTRPELT